MKGSGGGGNGGRSGGGGGNGGRTGGGGGSPADAGQPFDFEKSRSEIASNLREGKITVSQVETAMEAMTKAAYKEKDDAKADIMLEKASAMRSAVNLFERGAPNAKFRRF